MNVNTYNLIITISLFLLVNIARPVASIKCYQCSSNDERDCTEKFDHQNAKIQSLDCNVFEAKYCVKTTGMYGGEVGTKRFCTSHDWGDICEIVQRKGDFREYRSCLYTCSSDGCNGVSSIKEKSFAFQLLIAVIVIALTLHLGN